MKKFICLVIIVLMAVFSTVPAYAVDGTKNERTHELAAPQFTYISLLSPGINSSGKAACIGRKR